MDVTAIHWPCVFGRIDSCGALASAPIKRPRSSKLFIAVVGLSLFTTHSRLALQFSSVLFRPVSPLAVVSIIRIAAYQHSPMADWESVLQNLNFEDVLSKLTSKVNVNEGAILTVTGDIRTKSTNFPVRSPLFCVPQVHLWYTEHTCSPHWSYISCFSAKDYSELLASVTRKSEKERRPHRLLRLVCRSQKDKRWIWCVTCRPGRLRSAWRWSSSSTRWVAFEVANSQYSTVSYEVEDGQTVAFIAQKESIDEKIQLLVVTKSRSGLSGMQSTRL